MKRAHILRRPITIIISSTLSLALITLLLIQSNKENISKSLKSSSVVLREARNFTKKREIAIIHVGKTGGTTIDHILRKKMGDEISAQTKESFHCKPPNITRYESFIVTIRNPVDRIISWFLYAHPQNGLRPEYINDKVDLYECYHLPNLFAVNGLNLNATHEQRSKITGQSCQELAQYFIRGKRKKEHYYYPNYMHLMRNYEFYVKNLIQSKIKKEIFVVRTEFFWNDLDRINHIIGGGTNITRINAVTHRESKKKLKVTNKQIQPLGMKNLCFFLCPEIQYYKQLIRRAKNLNLIEKSVTVNNIRKICPLQTADEACHLPEI